MERARKKLLIASIDAGLGHRMYAEAIRDGIEKLYPGKYEIRDMDYAKEVGSFALDAFHKNVWSFLLKHPNAAKIMNFLTETSEKLSHRIESLLARRFLANSVRFASEYKPDIIVAVHPHTISMALATKKKLGLDIPVIGVAIELFDANGLYAHAGVDSFIVFSERAKEKLTTKGVPEEKIRIFDFVVRPAFTGKFDSREEIRKRLGLLPDHITVLMTAGGEGICRFEKYIKATLKADLAVQIVVITGRNERMEKKLSAIKVPAGSRTNVRVFGYVDNISEFLFMSDISFAKAGACSTMEALLMAKPVMYFRYVAENERQNLEFVRRNGVGWYVPTSASYVRRLKEIENQPRILDDIREKYRKLNIKSGTENVSRFIVNTMERNRL